MALNIAVPLSGVGDFFEGYGLLSPISPISLDCRENLKLLVSPLGSESSGVSSLDPEESKEKNSPTKELDEEIIVQKREEDYNVNYQGRNLLDLGSNLLYNDWNYKAAVLPENNFKMFLANRAQYHRLANSGNVQDYSMMKCQCCDFRYPVNNYTYNVSGVVNPAPVSYMNHPGVAKYPQNTSKIVPNNYNRNMNQFEFNSMPYGQYDNFKKFIDNFRVPTS